MNNLIKYRIFLLASLALLIGIWLMTRPDGKMRVIFCDVGQGDGILIVQGYTQIVIDSGPENGKMAECVSSHVPFWDKKIEAIIVTHSDSDHIGGLPILRKYYKVEENRVFVDSLVLGDMVVAGEIELRVLWPTLRFQGDKNENSLVSLLSYKNKKVLLMGDATLETEQLLVWREVLNYPVDILKVSHHGSKDGTGNELLSAVQPEEAVISVGKNNRFGHPTKDVLERLSGSNVIVRRTDIEGDIIYILD